MTFRATDHIHWRKSDCCVHADVAHDDVAHADVAQPSPIRWASRWDTYLSASDDQLHWFSIVNSLLIVLFLSGMVALIMTRTLHRDISAYNQLETAEEAQEETGWKLVRLAAPQSASCLTVV